MIPDSKTNFLYLADTLPKKYPKFFKEFDNVSKDCGISYKLLSNTKDVWAVDYMPIQIDKNNFIQFVYNPDYLRDTIKWTKTISDVDRICSSISLSPRKSNILLEGGNIIKATDNVIMCDKIFIENPTIKEHELINELQNLFQIDKLIFIPTNTFDFTGHADGMVRFYDDNTVIINDYSKEDINFQLRFRLALHNAGLKYIEIPYNPYSNKKDEHANGIYINYLQMRQAIVVPIFGIKDDEAVVKLFEQLFAGQKIATVDGNELAYNGEILNCITWNIYK
ncbi:MAG TPA: agmatine deiminase family protein [Aquella sp.]|nr:agmatine deiminase family protein [Aquella sp.]